MLQAVLEYINNWFEVETFNGTWHIESGVLQENTQNSKLQSGQFYRIRGSVFNDGLHAWPGDDLIDETFTGEITALAIPLELLKLVDSIDDWCDEHEKELNSPYESESFGGYSYKLASGSGGVVYAGSDAWKAVFGKRLNAWRKI